MWWQKTFCKAYTYLFVPGIIHFSDAPNGCAGDIQTVFRRARRVYEFRQFVYRSTFLSLDSRRVRSGVSTLYLYNAHYVHYAVHTDADAFSRRPDTLLVVPEIGRKLIARCLFRVPVPVPACISRQSCTTYGRVLCTWFCTVYGRIRRRDRRRARSRAMRRSIFIALILFGRYQFRGTSTGAAPIRSKPFHAWSRNIFMRSCSL